MTTRAELLQQLRDTLDDRRATRATLRDALQAAHDHLASNRAGRPRSEAEDAVRAILEREPQARIVDVARQLGLPVSTTRHIILRLREAAE
jgi:hypothetical protein